MTIAEFINKVGFKVNTGDVQKVNDTISDIKSTATKLLGAIGIGFSLANMNALVEEFDAINDKINFAVSGLGDAKEAQKDILAAANAVKTSYSDMADVVTNLVKANSDMFPIEEAISFSTNLTKLMKSAGRNDSEIASIMDGMNKSFQKGAVDTETLNKMLEEAPETANYLAEKLGVAKTELLQLATDGKISLEGMKAAFVESSDEIDAAFSQLNFSVSDALLNIRNKWGFWLKETDEMLGLTNTIGKFMVKGFDMAMSAINRLRNGVLWLSDKLGGTDKLLKILAISAGAIFLALNGGKILGFLKNVGTAIGSIKLQTLAIVAVIILVALLVEDFINFMQGNDSVIGALLEKAGVDVEAVRQKIIDAWTKIKAFLFAAWGAIKTTCSAVWNGIRDFFAKHGEEIKSALVSVWEGVSAVLAAVWRIISTTAIAIWDGLKNFWSKHGEQIKTSFVNIWNGIKNLLTTVWNIIKGVATAVFGALTAFWNTWGSTIMTYFQGVWNTIKAVFSAALDVLADLFAVFSALFAGDWSGLWEAVKQLASDVWNGILNIISTILTSIWNVLSSIWSTIWGFISETLTNIWNGITSTFTNILNSITETVGNIKNSIVEGFQAAIDWITSLPAQALQWGADIIQGIVDGITGAVGKVGEAVKGVADKIKSFLGFSEPEDGPLSDFHTYMPDMLQLMAEGIQKGKSVVSNAIKDLTGGMSDEVQDVDPNDGAPEPKKPKGGGSPKPTPPPAAVGAGGLDIVKGVVQWGADIIQGIVDGITGAVGKVGEAVKGVADKIKSFLGFSEPEDGPLSDFHTYMPDMLQLMAEGIQKGKSVVSNAIKDLTGGMSDEVQDVDPNDGAPEPKKPKGGGSPKPTPPPPDNGGGAPAGPTPRPPQAPAAAGAGGLDIVKGVVGAATKGIQTLVGAVKEKAGGSEGLKDAMRFIGNGMNALMGAATPRPSTVSTVTGSNNVSRSVVQNIEINNKYEGDRAGQQKSSQAAKQAGKDITSELARGLSYAR